MKSFATIGIWSIALILILHLFNVHGNAKHAPVSKIILLLVYLSKADYTYNTKPNISIKIIWGCIADEQVR